MKQSEFIQELKANLAERLNEQELADILSDYESFFAFGREEGQTDDQISQELGSPAFLAQSLLEEQDHKHEKTLNKHIANPGRRLCAYLIDAVVASIPSFIVSLFIGSAVFPFIFMILFYSTPALSLSVYTASASFSQDESYATVTDTKGPVVKTQIEHGENKSAPTLIFTGIVGIVFYLFYALLCTWLLKGQTLGKKLMRIKVRSSTTDRASKGAIFYREFLGKILINSIPIVPLVSVFTVLFTKEHKALHDMLADTIVSNC
ncbi:RDD family protein [Sporolactobacillus pectinivorans]|uniref:RDD family protein n=1 Tax=Sporolactobacillus pectinivorans TaxID=1591408 RepID=UPI0012FD1500|nr:RDD family protein [Sporolactobacillus pectinivorans]